MTLRGGGGGKGGAQAGRRSSTPSMSETHKRALDRLVASETKEKKRAERKKLVKLVKRVLKKGGVKLDTSSSSSSSDDDSDSSSESSDEEERKRKKKKKKKEKNKKDKREREAVPTKSEKGRIAELEARLQALVEEKASAVGELNGFKKAAMSAAEKGSLGAEELTKLADENSEKFTPKRPKTPAPSKTPGGFFAGCHPDGYTRNTMRSKEIWDGICGELDKAMEQGISLEKASVNNDVEVVCRKIAQALCRTHLECIETSDVKDVAEKHKCIGRARNKDNMVLGIVRALNFAGMRTGEEEELYGLTTKFEPF